MQPMPTQRTTREVLDASVHTLNAVGSCQIQPTKLFVNLISMNITEPIDLQFCARLHCSILIDYTLIQIDIELWCNLWYFYVVD